MLTTYVIKPESLNELLTETSAASWRASADGYVWDIPEWRNLTGQTQEEVEGMGWADAIHPSDRSHTLAQWTSCVHEERPYQATYRLRLADGSYRWFYVIGVPVKRADGKIDHWFGVCHDLGDKFGTSVSSPSPAPIEAIGASNLRAARAAANMTVEQLAMTSGVSATSIRRMEGAAEISRTRASILAKVVKAYAMRGIEFVLIDRDVLLRVARDLP